MEVIALQQYTDKYVSLYEGEIRNIAAPIAAKLIAKGIVAEHDETSGGGSSSGGGGISTVDDLPKLIMIDSNTIDGESVNACQDMLHFLLFKNFTQGSKTVVMNYIGKLTSTQGMNMIAYNGIEPEDFYNIKLMIMSMDDMKQIVLQDGEQSAKQYSYDSNSGNYILYNQN